MCNAQLTALRNTSSTGNLHGQADCVRYSSMFTGACKEKTSARTSRRRALPLCVKPFWLRQVNGNSCRVNVDSISPLILRSNVTMRCFRTLLFASTLMLVFPLLSSAQQAATVPATQAAPTTQSQIAALQQSVQNAQMNADNAWMLVSAALVLLMTGPGPWLFFMAASSVAKTFSAP